MNNTALILRDMELVNSLEEERSKNLLLGLKLTTAIITLEIVLEMRDSEPRSSIFERLAQARKTYDLITEDLPGYEKGKEGKHESPSGL